MRLLIDIPFSDTQSEPSVVMATQRLPFLWLQEEAQFSRTPYFPILATPRYPRQSRSSILTMILAHQKGVSVIKKNKKDSLYHYVGC